MKISDIIIKVNQALAEETLPISRIKELADDVIDEINTRLCSCFPSMTEFCEANTDESGVLNIDADYNYFPDMYIRSVLCKGAAYKFYVKDEEGNMASTLYSYDYKDSMFAMERDYIDLVPQEFIDTVTHGSQSQEDTLNPAGQPFPLDIWSW